MNKSWWQFASMAGAFMDGVANSDYYSREAEPRNMKRCGQCAFCPKGTFCKTAKHAVTKMTVANDCRFFRLPQHVYDAISFKDVWKFPLHMDDYSYAWSKDNTMALTFEDGDGEEGFKEMRMLAKNVVDAINGTAECETKGHWTHESVDFFLDGEYKFCVRGWGHLTGCGAMDLPVEEAERIQDEFIEYIFSKLN